MPSISPRWLLDTFSLYAVCVTHRSWFFQDIKATQSIIGNGTKLISNLTLVVPANLCMPFSGRGRHQIAYCSNRACMNNSFRLDTTSRPQRRSVAIYTHPWYPSPMCSLNFGLYSLDVHVLRSVLYVWIQLSAALIIADPWNLCHSSSIWKDDGRSWHNETIRDCTKFLQLNIYLAVYWSTSWSSTPQVSNSDYSTVDNQT